GPRPRLASRPAEGGHPGRRTHRQADEEAQAADQGPDRAPGVGPDSRRTCLKALPFKGRVGWGWVSHRPRRVADRTATSRKPIPIPACPAARSARGVHRRASRWLASAPLHPLEGEGEKKPASVTTRAAPALLLPLPPPAAPPPGSPSRSCAAVRARGSPWHR